MHIDCFIVFFMGMSKSNASMILLKMRDIKIRKKTCGSNFNRIKRFK